MSDAFQLSTFNVQPAFRRRPIWAAFSAAYLLQLSTFNLQPAFSAEPVSFARDLAPILARKCVTCHGPDKAKGHYRLHTFRLLNTPGDSKAAPLVPGRPSASKLFQLLITPDADDRMPQKDDPLPAAQIALIEQWIRGGAVFDGANSNAPIAAVTVRRDQPVPPVEYPCPVPVQALAFHPDGRWIASGGRHEVLIWEAATGKLSQRITNLLERILDLAYSPDGSLLAAASGKPGEAGEVALLDPVSGRLLKVLAALPDVALCLAFSADGRKLIAGGADNSIRLFAVADAAQAAEILKVEQHADWVLDVAFNADASRFISASRDRSARVYASADGDLLASYQGHEGPVLGAAFAPNSTNIALSLGKDRKLHTWRIDEGRKTDEAEALASEATRFVTDDSSAWVTLSDGTIHQFALADRKPLRVLEGHRDWVASFAVHAPTALLASGAHDGEIRLWNATNGLFLRAFIAAPGLQP